MTRKCKLRVMLEGSGTRKLGGRDPLRAFQRFFAWSIVALFVAVFPTRAHAYTWMIKHGYSGCAVCHADPSGGELLTEYGRVQSDLLLRMRYGKGGGAESTGSLTSRPVLARRNLELRTDALSGTDDDDNDEAPKADAAAKKDADAPADAAGDAKPPTQKLKKPRPPQKPRRPSRPPSPRARKRI